jgi:hypothetical protein
VNTIDDQITLMCMDQKRLKIDIQGIIEHKVDTGKYHVRQAFHASTRKVFDNATVEVGSSEHSSVTDYKPGGTAIIAQGDVTGRIHLHKSDKYGRWSYLSTQGAKGIWTLFITAYQVCKQPTKKTGISAYHQQQATFITEHRTNLDPRHNFRKDLLKFIQQHQNKGHRIVLSGDFNEHIHDNNSFLQEVSIQCKIIDIWKQKFPQIAEPNTYIRGTCRIDYILISRETSHAVVAVGYEPFHYTLPTDHRGVFIDFDTDKLFGDAHNPLPAAHLRKLQSKYTEGRKTYITEAHTHGEAHNLFGRLRTLIKSKKRDDALIEILDQLLGDCCHIGEQRSTSKDPSRMVYSKNQSPPHSPTAPPKTAFSVYEQPEL